MVIGLVVAGAYTFQIKQTAMNPYQAAIQAEQKKAYSRDCPRYFQAGILSRLTTMRKFSWCDDLKEEMDSK
ncbi:hypothetical protein F9K94_21860 [Brucella tritici]|uniref:Uncharacterized protein n=2 Tax=Brucella tritici TaxID=94626 RepID=A0A7V7VQZ2_9HYPH|nr:hypothetical protein F9K94_21860 [Brucella tritici]